MRADNNLVLLSGNRVLWHSRTYGQGTVALVAQGDDNIAVYRDPEGGRDLTRHESRPTCAAAVAPDGTWCTRPL